MWNALLGILEDGMLTLGDNSTTDFTRSIILMTSNVGSRELSELLDRRPMGFVPKAGPGRSAPADVREARPRPRVGCLRLGVEAKLNRCDVLTQHLDRATPPRPSVGHGYAGRNGFSAQTSHQSLPEANPRPKTT